MQVQDADFGKGTPVDGFGPGFFRVGGVVYEGNILLVPGTITTWAGFDDAAPLLALAGQVDVLFVGTGGEIRHIPRPLRDRLEAAAIGAEPMASADACRTYNILLAEGRRVAGALIAL
jgi:uncharacterized protein